MSETDTPTSPPDQPDGPYAFHAQPSALTWDYVRAILSFFLVLAIFRMAIAGSVIWWLLLFLLVAFAGYFLNTLWRHGRRLELDRDGLTVGWRNLFSVNETIAYQKRRLDWKNLKEVKVRYFSRKKNASESPWLMVKLVGEGPDGAPVTITLDGGHEGCKPVLNAAWDAIKRENVFADEPTLANIEALGIETQEGATPWQS